MEFWIDSCPTCGYCAHDLESKLLGSKELVAGEEYQVQLKSSNTPDLANKFLCLATLLKSDSSFNQAGWAALHAAWVIDDVNDDVQASTCRRKAIDLWLQSREAGQVFIEGDGADDTLLTDLYRRIGDWGDATAAAEGGLAKATDETIIQILKYEQLLIEKQDRDAHTVEDALATE